MACLSAPFCQTRRASIELLHCVATALSRAPGAGANIERHYRVDLRGLDHDLDVDLLVARTDAPPARSYFYRRDMQLIVDVGVGPYAGAIRRFRFDIYAEQVPVDLFGTLDQRLDIFALMPEQRFIDVHLEIEAGRVEYLLQFALNRHRPYLRRHADIDVDRAHAGEIIRPIGCATLDGADI